MLAPLHDDATIDEAVAARAREPGGYLIAADEARVSVPLEVRVTRRWREPGFEPSVRRERDGRRERPRGPDTHPKLSYD